MKPTAIFKVLLLVAATTAAPMLTPLTRQTHTLAREKYRGLQRHMQSGTLDLNQFITLPVNHRTRSSAQPATQLEPAVSRASNSTPAAGPAPAPGSLAYEALAVHNMERDALNISALSWSAELVRTAQSWADELIRKSIFRHSPPDRRPGSGENLYRGLSMGKGLSYREMMASWVEEKRFFVPGVYPEVSDGRGLTGRYTQIIWRNTKEIGCATAGQWSSGIVLVCHYKPPGNYYGVRIP